jgi:uncharacterized protein
LWIKPCNSIHTFGMKFSIDALFLDKKWRVVGLAKDLRPNRVSRIYTRASSVIEFPAGTLAATDTAAGDQLELIESRGQSGVTSESINLP